MSSLALLYLIKVTTSGKLAMISKKGYNKVRYIETVGTTDSVIKHFQDFLHSYFKKSDHYDRKPPVSEESSRFFAAAKSLLVLTLK